jgi:putative transposase
MKLVAQLKLKPTPQQHTLLKTTLERANAACNAMSDYAWEYKYFRTYDLHDALYHHIRAHFGLGAQMAIRCLAKVGDAYKLDTDIKRVFTAHGSIAYDSRILTYDMAQRAVSIWTLDGRETIQYHSGKHQDDLMQHQKGESDLAYYKGNWYLLATCDVPEPEALEIQGWLGVDRGVVNLAADSEGEIYQGDLVEARRTWHARRRRELQQVGTKSAKKRLRILSGQQARYQTHVNHCISKRLVQKAERTKQGIALEDLTGITLRTRVRHEDRAKRGNWGFDQLEQFVEYKAKRAGIPFKKVDPRYTSQRCSQCGYRDKKNRKSQAEFHCLNPHCGHTAHADLNAAVNIALKAACSPAYDLGGEADSTSATPSQG